MDRRTNLRDQIGIGFGILSFFFFSSWLRSSESFTALTDNTCATFTLCFFVSVIAGMAATRLVKTLEDRIP